MSNVCIFDTLDKIDTPVLECTVHDISCPEAVVVLTLYIIDNCILDSRKQ